MPRISDESLANHLSTMAKSTNWSSMPLTAEALAKGVYAKYGREVEINTGQSTRRHAMTMQAGRVFLKMGEEVDKAAVGYTYTAKYDFLETSGSTRRGVFIEFTNKVEGLPTTSVIAKVIVVDQTGDPSDLSNSVNKTTEYQFNPDGDLGGNMTFLFHAPLGSTEKADLVHRMESPDFPNQLRKQIDPSGSRRQLNISRSLTNLLNSIADLQPTATQDYDPISLLSFSGPVSPPINPSMN